RSNAGGFDVVVSGFTAGVDKAADAAQVVPFADAGATWWIESILPWKRPLDQARKRLRSGPPRL
ncbi:MAG: LLM class flavin-dependent oxidoreductase, partial [Candidatus Binataceae bacterium]